MSEKKTAQTPKPTLTERTLTERTLTERTLTERTRYRIGFGGTDVAQAWGDINYNDCFDPETGRRIKTDCGKPIDAKTQAAGDGFSLSQK